MMDTTHTNDRPATAWASLWLLDALLLLPLTGMPMDEYLRGVAPACLLLPMFGAAIAGTLARSRAAAGS